MKSVPLDEDPRQRFLDELKNRLQSVQHATVSEEYKKYGDYVECYTHITHVLNVRGNFDEENRDRLAAMLAAAWMNARYLD
jgi:hypothetical protein